MATSLSVFVQKPDENEFEFHVRRMEMLCNKNLMETAVGKKKVTSADGAQRDLQLYSYIRTDSFSRYVHAIFDGVKANQIVVHGTLTA
jgi:endoribonuclease Dicer